MENKMATLLGIKKVMDLGIRMFRGNRDITDWEPLEREFDVQR